MKNTLAYITNNIAPFRIDLLDELAYYFDSIVLYYYNEIDKGVNPEYVKRRPRNIQLQCLQGLNNVSAYKKIKNNRYIIFDGYSGVRKIGLILTCIFNQKSYMVSVDGIIKERNSSLIVKKLKKLLLSKSNTIFSTNVSTDEIIKEIYPNIDISRHIFTTLKCSDLQTLQNKNIKDIRKKYYIGDKKLITFIGKFVIPKGIREMIDCAIEIKEHFFFVGGTIAQLTELELDIPQNVTVVEFMEKKDILELLLISDVLVLPTYTDVWGLVVVEAISCGIPVITTEYCNAGLEFVKQGINGFIIKRKDSEELINSIRKGIKLDRLEVIDFNKNLMKNYTIENSAKKMSEIIYDKG